MKVAVSADRAVYHVREKAHVKIAVKTAAARRAALPTGAEVAVAAVDQGLLEELSPNETWKLLDAMMGERPYQIETSTAQMQVVGKRHYGLKAIPPGGGGGRQITRELFDTLLLWKAVVALDANGEAEVEVPLNDSLTSFKIVVVGQNAGTGLFGTGSTSIRSTQDLMLFAGVSPDYPHRRLTFDALPVHRAQRLQEARLRSRRRQRQGRGPGLLAQQPIQKLQLGPGATARSISWKINVPIGVAELELPRRRDHRSGRSLRPSADNSARGQGGAGAHLSGDARGFAGRSRSEQPVVRPADALPGVGGLAVTLSPSLVAGLDGVRQWMRDYPYACLEQRVSRAVALGDPKLWQGIIADLPSYTDSDGVLKYFPSTEQGSDVLTAYFPRAYQRGRT